MANDEVIGPRKTMFVLVIVVGCFAVLWPRILSPLVLGPTREQIQPNQFDREAALKQERAPPMRGMGPHPALRERGRAIPPGPPGPPPPPVRPVVLPPHVRVRSPLSVYYEVEQPPPIPGMRPPLGSPGGPVPAPKSSMGFVMPIYTICIIVFFVYTLSKILFRRTASPYDQVAPDPQFRRRVFRDDSRSSPDKLGKKEADTIVTAISGLVAEVQQQMEASYAQNQQRQDVQDNARPYTNGTILLNTGPVQIVTSEFKEAKEKTPEPVNEKEATPEPIEAEPTKVAKEPLEPDVVAPEPTVEPKESSPDIREPSPEPALTLEQKETALETVVVNESTPVLPQTQKNNEPSLEVIETITESEVVKEPRAEIEQPPEIPDEVVKEPISNDSLLTSVVSEVKEPVVERLVTEAIPEIDQAAQESSALQDSSDSVQILDLKHSLPDLESTVSELTETILQSKEPILELEQTILESNIPIPEIEKLVPVVKEPTSVPKDSSPELKESSPVPTKPTPDDEPIPEPKEPTPEPAELSPDRKEDISETNEPIPETKESSPISEGPTPATEELIPHLNKLDTKANEPIPEPKQSSPVPKEPVSAPEEAIPELKEPPTIPKEPTPEPKEPTPETKEPTPALEESIPELKEPTPVSEEPREVITSHTKEPISEPKEPFLVPKERTPEPEKLTPKPTLETKDILIDTEECELRDSSPDSKQSSPEGDLDIPESKETTPDTKEITPDTNESIPDSKESIPEHPTQKHPSSELIEPSQELDAPVVERSPEPSVDTSGLKEPTPQSKEPTPEPKLTADPESIQTNQVEDSSIPEGTLIDLNEAIADKIQKDNKQEMVNLKEEDIRPGDIEKDADRDASEELIKVFEGTDQKDDSATKATEKLLEEQRFVLVQSTPKVTEENNEAGITKASDSEEEEIENAAVKVVGMELTAHPADGGAWPRDLRPARPAPAAPAPHKAEEVKSIFLETEIPQQSRVLVAQFAEDREESSDKPRPAKHAPLVVSGKMTLSLIQDAPRETPERDPESTLDDFTTASALTQPAAEKGELESDEEVDEEIEVEEIEEEYEEDDEDEEPAPVKVVKK